MNNPLSPPPSSTHPDTASDHGYDRPGDDAALTKRARRRVGRKIGFYIHAGVFAAVNLGLFAVDTLTGGPRWSHFPLWGWGLGLAIHGLVTFIGLQGDGLRDRMVDAEVKRLRARNRG